MKREDTTSNLGFRETCSALGFSASVAVLVLLFDLFFSHFFPPFDCRLERGLVV